MRRFIRMKYLSQSGYWPSGRPRLYYRAPGAKSVRMPDYAPQDPRFVEAYNRLHGVDAPKLAQVKPGSIARAVNDYMASDAWTALASSTRQARARALRDFSALYGEGRLSDLLPKHLRRDLAPLAPQPAINRLKVWRALLTWCHRKGRIETNPARDVDIAKPKATGGRIPWTQSEVDQFRAHWACDTRERLAFELLHWVACSIKDACTLTRGDIGADGWLVYQRGKSGSYAAVPWSCDAPTWAGDRSHLLKALSARVVVGDHFILTAYGKPRSEKSAASWISKSADAAGLPKHCTAHGIRKYRARFFRENGATPEQRMAWLGHESKSETEYYSRGADLKKVINLQP